MESWLTGYKRFEPENAKHYHDAGIDSRVADAWNALGFDGADAIKWIQSDFSYLQANVWRRNNVTDVEEVKDWIALGVVNPADAGVLKELGSESAQNWVDANVGNLRHALTWNKFVKPGYSEKDLAPFVNGEMNVSAEVFEDWQKGNVPADQIVEFLEKGYTPKRAVSRIEKGKTAAQSEDLRAGEIVPGKAWKDIKAEVLKSANTTGCKVNYSEFRTQGDHGVIVEIRLDRKEERGSARGYDYRMRFTNTGRFISADAIGRYRPIRKVSEALDEIRAQAKKSLKPYR